MLLCKEHYDLIEMFEKDVTGYRTDKEPKELWASGNVYQHGEYNKLFHVYRKGYAFGKTQ
jgi:hypothetical protein